MTQKRARLPHRPYISTKGVRVYFPVWKCVFPHTETWRILMQAFSLTREAKFLDSNFHLTCASPDIDQQSVLSQLLEDAVGLMEC